MVIDKQGLRRKYQACFELNDRTVVLTDTLIQQWTPKPIPNMAPYERVVLLAFAKARKTFIASKLLCEEGYGEDAGILLRSLLNLYIEVRWIAMGKKVRAEKYLDWFWMEAKQDLDEVKQDASLHKRFAVLLTNETEVIRNYNRVEPTFHYTSKGKQRRCAKWHDPHSIRDMAKEAGVEDDYVGCYKELSHIEHSDALSLAFSIGQKINCGPSDRPFIGRILLLNFKYFGSLVGAFDRTFNLGAQSQIEQLFKEAGKIDREFDRQLKDNLL